MTRRYYRKARGYPQPSKPTYVARAAVGLAKSAAKRMIQAVMNVEYKKVDNSQTPTSCSWSGNLYNLSNVAEGDTVTSRDGYSIKPKYVALECVAKMHASGVTSEVLFLLFTDTNATTTNPVASDVITDTGTVNAPLGRIPIANGPRFHIIRRKLVKMSQPSNPSQIFKIYHKFSNKHHIKYTGSASTDEGKNALWLLIISNEQTNTPSCGFVSRIAFIDN